jgi:hypothetical protein
MFAEPDLLVARLVFVGLLIEAYEIVTLRWTFSDQGLFSRRTLSILTGSVRPYVRIGSTMGGSRAMTAAMLLQGTASFIVILCGTGSLPGICSALICMVTNGYLLSRRQIGSSGAEQLTFIVLVAFALVMLAGGGEQARRVGDAFIAAQLVLAYFTSGVAKLIAPIWREGAVLNAILATEGYGAMEIAKSLSAHPAFDKFLCWFVIAWEIGFPVVLIVPTPVMIVILSIGVAFHLSCSVLMGLNRFLWAFCGCYPAIWSTAMLLK